MASLACCVIQSAKGCQLFDSTKPDAHPGQRHDFRTDPPHEFLYFRKIVFPELEFCVLSELGRVVRGLRFKNGSKKK